MKAYGKKLFVGIENVRGFFLVDIASVHEIEHPYRSCNHAWYLHLWPSKAIVIGWWKKRHDQETNLMKAVGGRVYVSQEDFQKITSKVEYGLPQNPQQDFVDEFA